MICPFYLCQHHCSIFTFLVDAYYSYRIRLPTEKELEMKVSKEVKKMRLYESTLLKAYKVSIYTILCYLSKFSAKDPHKNSEL